MPQGYTNKRGNHLGGEYNKYKDAINRVSSISSNGFTSSRAMAPTAGPRRPRIA